MKCHMAIMVYVAMYMVMANEVVHICVRTLYVDIPEMRGTTENLSKFIKGCRIQIL